VLGPVSAMARRPVDPSGARPLRTQTHRREAEAAAHVSMATRAARPGPHPGCNPRKLAAAARGAGAQARAFWRPAVVLSRCAFSSSSSTTRIAPGRPRPLGWCAPRGVLGAASAAAQAEVRGCGALKAARYLTTHAPMTGLRFGGALKGRPGRPRATRPVAGRGAVGGTGAWATSGTSRRIGSAGGGSACPCVLLVHVVGSLLERGLRTPGNGRQT
jgi:hypothetical protein